MGQRMGAKHVIAQVVNDARGCRIREREHAEALDRL
jgi:hypothetical protein